MMSQSGLQVDAEWCLKWCADKDHHLLEKERLVVALLVNGREHWYVIRM